VDATFESVITLASPNNPAAVDGVITVVPGNHMPSIPKHRVKAGAEYAVTDSWKLGTELVAASGQYLRGDEANLNPQIPGYWVVNLFTSYQVTKNFELFGRVQNLFDRRYYTYGTFFDPTAIRALQLTDARTLTPAAPLAAYAGIRVTF
jgi:iron complex outermembrane receptor protein